MIRVTIFAGLALLALTSGHGQELPQPEPMSVEERLITAVDRLTNRLDAMNTPAPVSLAAPIRTSDACGLEATYQVQTSCDVPPQAMTMIETQACDDQILRVQSDPCARRTQWTVDDVFQTTRTRVAPLVVRSRSSALYEWNTTIFDCFTRRNLRAAGTYVIETKPRLFGLLGTKVRVYQ